MRKVAVFIAATRASENPRCCSRYAASWAASITILYVSGEESERQIKLRADRLGVTGGGLLLASGNNCESIIQAVRKNKPDIVIIDSIQTITSSGITSSAGSVVQVRECTNAFMHLAKSEEIPIFIVSHVNKDGGIAGPKIMEHIVDTVLYFEGEKQLSYRILRAIKNRFGSTNEIGVFNMDDDGLHEVTNPSEMMLSGRITTVSGSAVVCTIEGTRPILAEVQALVTKSTLSAPRRVATGFDYNRLYMILAVLEKRTGFFFGGVDVYVNIVGGLRLDEPAADLAVALALYSGLCDKVIPEKLMVFGEVGLGGEVRAASHVRERVKEGARLGFERCIIPKQSFSSLSRSENYGIQIIGVRTLEQAFRAINADQGKGEQGMTNCDDCVNYVYDEECDCWTCLVNLDEDEMYRFMCGTNYNCPYYSSDDEYSIARKQ